MRNSGYIRINKTNCAQCVRTFYFRDKDVKALDW
jgi:hypothetical protein